MVKKRVVNGLEEIALLLELAGESPFRIRAYENAARTIKSLPYDLEEAIRDGSLQEIKGIGSNISERIQVLAQDESPPYLVDLRSRFRPGALEMFRQGVKFSSSKTKSQQYQNRGFNRGSS